MPIFISQCDAIAHGSDANKAVEARGLYQQIRSFTFLTTLVVFDKILSITKGISDELQSQNVDLACAASLVTACEGSLEAFRSDQMWEKLFKYVSDICERHDIEIGKSLYPQRKRRPPRQLDDSIVYESSGSRSVPDCSSQLKVELFFPVVDAFLVELRKRFDDKNISIMKGIQACHPHSKSFFSFSELKPLADVYNLTASQTLESELEVARRLFIDKENFTKTNDVFLRLYQLRDAFPTLSNLVKIAMTIAVSTASCERSFSALKRIKTYIRSTMGDQRLSDLGILCIERDHSKNIPFDHVLEQFVNKDQNRRITLS
ncbi:PREDICTED: zinc finger MYM-type protein 1-like [Amphimedon queenslandica]|uniref:HAT C-terminal dimerisation domain-containing protein n=2 Tax=Amphimedon queenslandica TaxID=400682 RepID=A0AAN0IRW3_AMPQE|nr:PREDICTED: zinc finger MYM-type protein 1-like [Amphimedon queenslandica]|eukprot:XP_011408214.1 PREDICTED: zinc finger MYM-type protein 1-like [Amphimedon queenslandica]